jgi:hypothetical protein
VSVHRHRLAAITEALPQIEGGLGVVMADREVDREGGERELVEERRAVGNVVPGGEGPRALVVLGGLRVREERGGAVAGLVEVLARLEPVVRRREVVRETVPRLATAGGGLRLDRAGHRAVQLAALPREQAMVGHVLDQRGAEGELDVGKHARLVHQLQPAEDVQMAVETRLGREHLREEGPWKFAPDHGRSLERLLDGLVQRVDAGPDDVLPRGRKVDDRGTRPRDARRRPNDRSALDERPEDLFHEERVALRLVVNEARQPRRQVPGAESGRQHGLRPGLVQRVERDLGDVGAIGPAQ